MLGLSRNGSGLQICAMHMPCISLHPVPTATRPRTTTLVITCGSRVALVKTSLNRQRRSNKRLKDVIRRVDLVPSDQHFEEKLSAEINNAVGRNMMASLVGNYGQFMTAEQLGFVLARLVGFVNNKLSKGIELQAHGSIARKCLRRLAKRVDEADHIVLARAAYAMGRLQVPDEQLISLVISRTETTLHLFRPETMAGLLTGLAACSAGPPKQWLHTFLMESYLRMSKFTPNELANIMHALSEVKADVSEVYADAALRFFRDGFGPACFPLALVRFITATARLRIQPSFNWRLAFLGELRTKVDFLDSEDLTAVMWSLAQLSHRPDLIFLEVWCKRAAKCMDTFSLEQLAVSLSSLAVLEAGPIPGRFGNEALGRLSGGLAQLPPGRVCGIAWALVVLRIRPTEEFMEELLIVSEESLDRVTAQQLVDLLWALGRLRYQPVEMWVEAAQKAVSRQLGTMTLMQLGLAMWALQRVEYDIPREWSQQFLSLARKQCTPEQLSDVSALVDGMADSILPSSTSPAKPGSSTTPPSVDNAAAARVDSAGLQVKSYAHHQNSSASTRTSRTVPVPSAPVRSASVSPNSPDVSLRPSAAQFMKSLPERLLARKYKGVAATALMSLRESQGDGAARVGELPST